MTKAYKTVLKARETHRLTCSEIIAVITDDFLECHGDRLHGDDPAVIGGIGVMGDIPVTIIGTEKGHNLQENMRVNFGSSGPDGYRKAQRLMQQANKFARPIITIINTPGAFCSPQAEEGGIGQAIATSLMQMSDLRVPVIAILTGEGGSGGALAFALANEVWAFEHAIYSILSPEGFASILWKDSKKASKAAEVMRLTSDTLYQDQIVDKIISEEGTPHQILKRLKAKVMKSLTFYQNMSEEAIILQRQEKFRNY